MPVTNNAMARSARKRFISGGPVTKSTGISAITPIVIPNRARLRRVHFLVTTTFQTNDINFQIGFTAIPGNTTASNTAYANNLNTGAINTPAGTLVIRDIPGNPVVPAGTALRVNQATSTGNGVYFWVIEYEFLDDEPGVDS